MSLRTAHYARLLGVSAIWAAAIVALSVTILLALLRTGGSGGVLGAVGTVLAGPGLLLAYMLHTGAGPEGAPHPTDVAPYALNFLFWWVISAVVLAWRGEQSGRQR